MSVATTSADDTAPRPVASASAHHTPRRSPTRRAAPVRRTEANSSRAKGIANVRSPTLRPITGRTMGMATSAANIAVTSWPRAGGCHSSGGVPAPGRGEFYAFDESAGLSDEAWAVSTRLRPGGSTAPATYAGTRAPAPAPPAPAEESWPEPLAPAAPDGLEDEPEPEGRRSG